MRGISSLSLVNVRGVVIVHRAYRDDAARSQLETFKMRVTSRTHQENTRAPVLYANGVSFVYVRHGDIYVVATTTNNANAMMAVQYMYQFIGILATFLGATLSEAVIRKNFSLIHELLDETLDYGVPQNCSTDALRMCLSTVTGSVLDMSAPGAFDRAAQLTEQITGKTDWRRADIVHKENQVYIEVVESVNALVAVNGDVLSSDCTGEIRLKSLLSGMPECKIVINDKLFVDQDRTAEYVHPDARRRSFTPSSSSSSSSSSATSGSALSGLGDANVMGVSPLAAIAGATSPSSKKTIANSSPRAKSSGVDIADMSFHRCVRLGRFDVDRSIIFIPPDGTFELMKYRINSHVSLPFRVIPVVEQSKLSVTYAIRVSCDFPPEVTARTIVVKIPCPPTAYKADASCSQGRAKFEPGESAIVWRLRTASGGQEFILNATVDVAPSSNTGKSSSSSSPSALATSPSNKSSSTSNAARNNAATAAVAWAKPPITLQFKVRTFTSSGLNVRYIQVIEKSGYKSAKYLRYLTVAGSYQFRF